MAEKPTRVATPARVTKVFAVRAAISAGVTRPKDGCAYIRYAFGIEVTPVMFSAIKAVLKKRQQA